MRATPCSVGHRVMRANAVRRFFRIESYLGSDKTTAYFGALRGMTQPLHRVPGTQRIP